MISTNDNETPASTPQEPQAKILTSKNPVIQRLVELQGHEKDSMFAKRWLGISPTTWYRLKNDEYGAQPEHMIERCRGGLAALEDYLSLKANNGVPRRVIKLTIVKQALEAIKIASAQSRDRLAVVLAPTGGGKSMTIAAVQEQYPGRVAIAEATEPWRGSYLAACLGVGKALGLSDIPTNKRLAESAVITELTSRPRILAVDEAHYFGPSTINLIKAILNLTNTTVLLLAIPSLWSRMKSHAWEEAEQIRSRTTSTVDIRECGYKDVSDFVEDRIPNAKSDLGKSYESAIVNIIASSNRFGLWDTVERICEEAISQSNKCKLTLDIINNAISTGEAVRR